MKKNTIVAAFAAATAILLVSSCAKEQLRENINTGDGKVFSAAISQNLTKTTITSEYKVNWEQGDQIDINGTTYSATPDASDATKATFTKVSGSDPDGTSGYTAVYPASIMVGTQATLPATQTYAAGKFNAPMCAMSSTETLEFKNFCGVLCFALKGTDKVKSIAVTANEQLCGPFEFADATSFSFSGGNVGYTVTLNCGEGVQLSATDSTNFYISLPPATYTAGMKIVVTSTEGKTFEKTTTTSATIARNKIYTFNWTASFSPAGALKGEFSVSATKKVHFSQGNLYWDGDSFELETNQYDVQSSWSTSHVSHFYWSKDASVATAMTYSDAGASDGDVFFTNAQAETAKSDFTVNGVTGKYRTLSKDEWTYLFNTRTMTNGKDRYSNAVSGVTIGGSTYNGVFLYPDNYNGEIVSGSMTWDDINAAGIVFLPVAGFRDGSDVSSVGGYGYYWSSTASGEDGAYSVYFDGYGVGPGTDDFRYYGYSVRLITDASVTPAPTPTTKGTAKATIGGKDVDVKWIQLWENGPKFAEYNVGVTDGKAESYGGYYAWGGNQDVQGVANPTYNTGTSPLTGADDTATKLWGSNWRMPTSDELGKKENDQYIDGLLGKCTCVWTTNYNSTGVNGLLCTGKGAYASNSVFLPAAGTCSSGSVSGQGVRGGYWSSTPNGSNNVYYLYFDSSSHYMTRNFFRSGGYSVRAVLAE